MFTPSQADVRNFFFDAFAKFQAKQQLTAIEQIAVSVILEHQEYSEVLQNREKYLTYQWPVEMGITNPFLHMSMHLSIVEQLSIDQPKGIKAFYDALCLQCGDNHQATHELIDCFAEMLWMAERGKETPSPEVYFACIKQKLKIA